MEKGRFRTWNFFYFTALARVKGGGSVESIPVHGTVNGFFINEMGNLTIVIEYKPQRWFVVGMGITIGGIVLSVGFLILADRRLWAHVLRRRIR